MAAKKAEQKALVLAGGGMLSAVAEDLVANGWYVVLPSRRYSPPAARQVESRAHRSRRGRTEAGRAVWVEAEWMRPRELARAADGALGGHADLLVAWVHEAYRRSVLGVVESLLAPGAPVVEVREGGWSDPVLTGRPTQGIVLGSVSERDSGRSLIQSEVVGGVAAAVARALDGHPSTVHTLGQAGRVAR
ncbi:hypothetical protein [Amycolatopsis minnesotensis]|uniref:Short-chain dehydrogenase n=1 Tax=Amycolatopsis minnesotensis TaxID=337894 RepID=A0ABP5DBT0_9PSEU